MPSRSRNSGRHRALAVAAAILGGFLALAATARPSRAETASRTGYQGFGPVLGVGVDPDQVHLGLRFDLGEISTRLDLRTGFEVGVGDGRTRGAFLVDALYRFREQWDVWQPYLGGGIGLAVVSREVRNPNYPYLDETRTEAEPGINLIGGVAKSFGDGDRFQAELRIGIGEAPDLGLSVAWLFR